MDTACIAYWTREEAPGYGVLYTRYRINAGPAGVPSREGVPSWLDIWEDGVFRTAQSGQRVVVAYGIPPRGLRPIDGMRLDIRLMGPEAALADGREWRGGKPLDVRSMVVVEDGDVLIGIRPLAPERLGDGRGVVLWRDSGETVLSIANYDGPAKQFWEYRSLSGPFWKGNVRNGFALWIVPRAEHASREAFAAALAATPLTDESSGSVRTITFEDVTLTYDLREMWP
jgi:hypothetical protein